jgi:peptidoglycan/LPS O-acetylase OafA/YrhL
MPRRSMLLWAGGTLLFIIGLMLFFLAVVDVDRKIPDGFEKSRGDQCEKLNVGGSILEPQNTWSNVGYLMAGLLVFYRSRRLRSVVVGLFLCLTAVFSAMYHAVPTNGTLQTLDIAAVFWVLLALIGFGILSLDFHFYGNERDIVWEKLVAIVSFVLGTLVAITRTKVAPFESTKAFVALIFVLLVLLFLGYINGKDPKTNLSHGEKGTFLAVLIVIAIPTGVFRLFDGYDNGTRKFMCDPNWILQSHAMWHILSAALLLIGFDYFSRVANQSDERIFAD